MQMKCAAGEESSVSLGLQGEQTSQFKRKSTLNIFGTTDADAEAPIHWPLDAKSWAIEKDSNAGKDSRQKENGKIEDAVVR